MISGDEDLTKHCVEDPNFAVVCSFFEHFSNACGIPCPSFEQLQEMLEIADKVPQELIDLHIKLLRKARKNVSIDRWEKALVKLCYIYSADDGWHLERLGYKNLTLSARLRILKILLEAQFDWNVKFKNDVNKLSAENLRVLPLGRDLDGRSYWVQSDSVSDIRVYREDLEEEMWNLVAKDGETLITLIRQLDEKQEPEYRRKPLTMTDIKKEEQEQVKEEEGDSGGDDTMEQEEVSSISTTNGLITRGNSEEDKTLQHSPVAAEYCSKSLLAVNDRGTLLDSVVKKDSIEKKSASDPGLDINKLHNNSSDFNTPVSEVDHEESLKMKINLQFSRIKPVISKSNETCSVISSLSSPPSTSTNPRSTFKVDTKCVKNFVDDLSKAGCVPPDTGIKLESILRSKLAMKFTTTAEKIPVKEEKLYVGNNCDDGSVSNKLLQSCVVYDGVSITKKVDDHSLGGKIHAESSSKATCPVNDEVNDNVSNCTQNGGQKDSARLESITVDQDEEIEEPTMLITGVGFGSDCQGGNLRNCHQSEQQQQKEIEAANTDNNSDKGVHDETANSTVAVGSSSSLPVDSREDVETGNSTVSYLLNDCTASSVLTSVDEQVSAGKSSAADCVEENNGDDKESKGVCFFGTLGEINIPSFWDVGTDKCEELSDQAECNADAIAVTQNDECAKLSEQAECNIDVKAVAQNDDIGKCAKSTEQPECNTGATVAVQSDDIEECAKSSVQSECNTEVIAVAPDSNTDEYAKLPEQGYRMGAAAVTHFLPDFQKAGIVSTGSLDKAETRQNSNMQKSTVPEQKGDLFKMYIDKKEEGEKGDDNSGLDDIENKISEIDILEKDSPSPIPCYCPKPEGNSENNHTVNVDVGNSDVVEFSSSPNQEPVEEGGFSDCFSSSDDESTRIEKVEEKELSDGTGFSDCFSDEDEENSKHAPSVKYESADSSALSVCTTLTCIGNKEEVPVEGNSSSLAGGITSNTEAAWEEELSPNSATSNSKVASVFDIENKDRNSAEEGNNAAADMCDTAVCSDVEARVTSSTSNDKKVPLYSEIVDTFNQEENTAGSICSREGANTLKEEEGITVPIFSEEVAGTFIQEEGVTPPPLTVGKDVIETDIKTSCLTDEQEFNKVLCSTDKTEQRVLNLSVDSYSLDNEQKIRNICLNENEEKQVSDDEGQGTDVLRNQGDSAKEEEYHQSFSHTKHCTVGPAEMRKTDFDSGRKQEEGGVSSNVSTDVVQVPESDKVVDSEPSPPLLKSPEPLDSDDGFEIGEGFCGYECEASDSGGLAASMLEKCLSERDGIESKMSVMFKDSSDDDEVAVKEEQDFHSEVIREKKSLAGKVKKSSSVPKKETPVSAIEPAVPEEEVKKKKRGRKPKNLVGAQKTDNEDERRGNLNKKRVNAKNEIKWKRNKDNKRGPVTVDEKKKKEKTKVGAKGKVMKNSDGEKTKGKSKKFPVGKKIASKKLAAAKVKPGLPSKNKKTAVTVLPCTMDSVNSEHKKSPKKRGRKRKIADTKKDEQQAKEITNNDEQEAPAANETKQKGARKKRLNPDEQLCKSLYSMNDESLSSSVTESGGGRAVRQSRRIAQLKIKQQADYCAHPNRTKTSAGKHSISGVKEKSGTKKGTKKNKRKKEGPEEEEEEDEAYEPAVTQCNDESKKKKKSKKGSKEKAKWFNVKNPWKSSSSSSGSEGEQEEEEEEVYYEEEELKFDDRSDHEFSPESDIDDDDEDYVPVKQARTAKQKLKKEGQLATVAASTDDESMCKKCGKADDPEWILLCDSCDSGWHAACLKPPLVTIPEGDWFCPPCQHNKLISGLQSVLKMYSADKVKKENEELRRKRLEYVGISLSNMLPPSVQKAHSLSNNVSKEEEYSSSSSSSSDSVDYDAPLYQLRVRKQTSYRNQITEFDDLINSAIQHEMQPAIVAPQSIIDDNKSTVDSDLKQTADHAAMTTEKAQHEQQESEEETAEAGQEEEEDSSNVLWKASRVSDGNDGSLAAARGIGGVKKKHTKLTQLDMSSDEDHYSDEDFKQSSLEEEDDDEYKAGGTDSSEDDLGGRRKSKRVSEPTRRSTRARTTRFDRDFVDDDSEYDSEHESKKRKSRKSLNYSDSDSEEEEDSTWGKRKKKRYSSPWRKKKSNKRKARFSFEDEDEALNDSKRKKRRRVTFGLNESQSGFYDSPLPRTRGKKVSYQEQESDNSDADLRLATALGSKKLRKGSDDEDYNIGDQDDGDEEEEGEIDADEEDAEEDITEFCEDGENYENDDDGAPKSDEEEHTDSEEAAEDTQKRNVLTTRLPESRTGTTIKTYSKKDRRQQVVVSSNQQQQQHASAAAVFSPAKNQQPSVPTEKCKQERSDSNKLILRKVDGSFESVTPVPEVTADDNSPAHVLPKQNPLSAAKEVLPIPVSLVVMPVMSSPAVLHTQLLNVTTSPLSMHVQTTTVVPHLQTLNVATPASGVFLTLSVEASTASSVHSALAPFSSPMRGSAFTPSVRGSTFSPAIRGSAFPTTIGASTFPSAIRASTFPLSARGLAFPPVRQSAFPPVRESLVTDSKFNPSQSIPLKSEMMVIKSELSEKEHCLTSNPALQRNSILPLRVTSFAAPSRYTSVENPLSNSMVFVRHPAINQRRMSMPHPEATSAASMLPSAAILEEKDSPGKKKGRGRGKKQLEQEKLLQLNVQKTSSNQVSAVASTPSSIPPNPSPSSITALSSMYQQQLATTTIQQPTTPAASRRIKVTPQRVRFPSIPPRLQLAPASSLQYQTKQQQSVEVLTAAKTERLDEQEVDKEDRSVLDAVSRSERPSSSTLAHSVGCVKEEKMETETEKIQVSVKNEPGTHPPSKGDASDSSKECIQRSGVEGTTSKAHYSAPAPYASVSGGFVTSADKHAGDRLYQPNISGRQITLAQELYSSSQLLQNQRHHPQPQQKEQYFAAESNIQRSSSSTAAAPENDKRKDCVTSEPSSNVFVKSEPSSDASPSNLKVVRESPALAQSSVYSHPLLKAAAAIKDEVPPQSHSNRPMHQQVQSPSGIKPPPFRHTLPPQYYSSHPFPFPPSHSPHLYRPTVSNAASYYPTSATDSFQYTNYTPGTLSNPASYSSYKQTQSKHSSEKGEPIPVAPPKAKAQDEAEDSGEFGGLVSYFSSQRTDDDLGT